MKILKPALELREIGDIYAALRLQTAHRRGMKTKCAACNKQIEDEFFIGAFVRGHHNIILHESCTPEGTRIEDKYLRVQTDESAPIAESGSQSPVNSGACTPETKGGGQV